LGVTTNTEFKYLNKEIQKTYNIVNTLTDISRIESSRMKKLAYLVLGSTAAYPFLGLAPGHLQQVIGSQSEIYC
jgi:hypothetical protein